MIIYSSVLRLSEFVVPSVLLSGIRGDEGRSKRPNWVITSRGHAHVR